MAEPDDLLLSDAERLHALTVLGDHYASGRLDDSQFHARSGDVAAARTLAQLRDRDARDSTRAATPLRPAPDAVFLDTTTLTIDEAIARAVAEVEAALNEHPAVVQSAVIGRSLPGGNEEVLAFCQLAAPGAVGEAELSAFVAARLSPYKRPSRIVCADSLPAAPTGKILKTRLIEVFAAALA